MAGGGHQERGYASKEPAFWSLLLFMMFKFLVLQLVKERVQGALFQLSHFCTTPPEGHPSVLSC